AWGPVARAYTTGLLHFAQKMSPLTLKRGFPHSGQTSASIVAPDFRRSAIRFTSSDNFQTALRHDPTIEVAGRCINHTIIRDARSWVRVGTVTKIQRVGPTRPGLGSNPS